MNKCIFKGNLVKDIETKTNNRGEEYAYFTIATKRDYKNASGEYESDFLRCIAFGNNVEILKKYFKKGSGILVEGRVRTSSYTDSKGNKVYTTDFPIDKIEFIDKFDKEQPYKEMGKKVEEDFEFPF